MDFDPRDSDVRDEARWSERERGEHDRTVESRDTFSRGLDLPRGADRELVRDRDREYTLRGSETRTLATLGAFRVVSSGDLRDANDRPLDPRSGAFDVAPQQRLHIRRPHRRKGIRPRPPIAGLLRRRRHRTRVPFPRGPKTHTAGGRRGRLGFAIAADLIVAAQMVMPSSGGRRICT